MAVGFNVGGATSGYAEIGANLVPVSVEEKLYGLDADDTPFLIFQRKFGLKKITAYDTTFKYLEDQEVPSKAFINKAAGYPLGTELTFQVDNGQEKYFEVGAIVIHIPSGEKLGPVASIDTSAHTFTIASGGRSYGSVDAAAFVDNDEFRVLPISYADKQDTTITPSSQPDLDSNYIQDFRSMISLSTIEAAVKRYGYSELDRLRAQKFKEWKKKVEAQFLDGEGKTGTNANGTYWHTAGIIPQITGNMLKAYTVTPTKQDFHQWLGQYVFAHTGGSNTKIAFLGNLAVDIFANWKDQKLEFKPVDRVYDLKLASYSSPHGDLILVRHKMFDGDTWGSRCLIVDPEFVGEAQLVGAKHKDQLWMDTQNKASIQLIQEQYRGVKGLRLPWADAYHGLATGFKDFTI